MLYTDLDDLQDSAYMKKYQAETGAVLMGRRTFDLAGDPDFYADSYEFQVPIVVLTHRAPEREPRRNDRLFFTFVTDGLEAAVARAVDLAGDKAVTVVGGADLNPAAAGRRAGRRAAHRRDAGPARRGAAPVEKLGVDEEGARTTLRFRVLR